MVGKTAPIRRQDEIRFKVIREYTGCLCCMLDRHDSAFEEISQTTIEHVTDRGRRLADEHQATIGLCPWHHQATPWTGLDPREMNRILGPSLANGRKPFEEHYGDEVDVLLRIQDELILAFADNPWQEYTVPRAVREMARELWKKLKRNE